MVVKEMATDLFNKFMAITNFKDTIEMRKSQARAMCRICIDEIINACNQVYDSDMVHFRETGTGEWWLAVKKEIEQK